MDQICPRKAFPTQKWKSEEHRWIIPISWSIKSHYRHKKVEFGDQICPKDIFRVKNLKSEHYHWFLPTKVTLGTKFLIKLRLFIFWTKYTRKGFFFLKQKKWTAPLNSEYQVSIWTNNFDFLDYIRPKRVFPV